MDVCCSIQDGVLYDNRELHLGCCSSPRSASDYIGFGRGEEGRAFHFAEIQSTLFIFSERFIIFQSSFDILIRVSVKVF